MTRTVKCVYLDKEAAGLTRVPYPGDLGKRMYDNVCQEAWQEWLKHQTMLINEKQLSLMDADSRKYLQSEMEKFFNNESHDTAEGFIPSEK